MHNKGKTDINFQKILCILELKSLRFLLELEPTAQTNDELSPKDFQFWDVKRFYLDNVYLIYRFQWHTELNV